MTQTKRSIGIIALILLSGTLAHSARQAPPPPNPADMKEFYNYALTMDKIRRLAAAEKEMDALQKTDPQLSQSMQNDTSVADLDQAVQKLQKYPQAVTIIKKNGFTPHEYVVSTITFIQAATAVGFKKSGNYKDYPPQVRQVVSAANLAFVEQHWDEIAKTMPTFLGNNGSQK